MDLTSTHNILDVSDLSIGYFRKNKALSIAENINFSIGKGELIGLVGANGVGKSTLLRTLACMQQKIKGDILLNNKPIIKHTSIQLATQLSVVLTEAPASKNLTVYELIALGRQPYTNWIGSLTENDKNSIQWALEATETDAISSQKCFELSDGQLQRVYIARALAQDTPLIILDEPTTHLDLYHRAYILKLLKSLAEETNKGILFSTHEIDSAIQLSDKILVMSPEGNYFARPDSLIKEGKFDLLFPNNTIDFDRESGRFTIKK